MCDIIILRPLTCRSASSLTCLNLLVPPPPSVQDVCSQEEAHLLGILCQLHREGGPPVQLQAGAAGVQRYLSWRAAGGGELRSRQSLRPDRHDWIQESLPTGGEVEQDGVVFG